MELHVGMTRAEYQEFYGRTLENGWYTSYSEGGIIALSIESVIVSLNLNPGKEWALENGIKIGMSVDKVRQLLGVENTITPRQS